MKTAALFLLGIALAQPVQAEQIPLANGVQMDATVLEAVQPALKVQTRAGVTLTLTEKQVAPEWWAKRFPSAALAEMSRRFAVVQASETTAREEAAQLRAAAVPGPAPIIASTLPAIGEKAEAPKPTPVIEQAALEGALRGAVEITETATKWDGDKLLWRFLIKNKTAAPLELRSAGISARDKDGFLLERPESPAFLTLAPGESKLAEGSTYFARSESKPATLIPFVEAAAK